MDFSQILSQMTDEQKRLLISRLMTLSQNQQINNQVQNQQAPNPQGQMQGQVPQAPIKVSDTFLSGTQAQAQMPQTENNLFSDFLKDPKNLISLYQANKAGQNPINDLMLMGSLIFGGMNNNQNPNKVRQ